VTALLGSHGHFFACAACCFRRGISERPSALDRQQRSCSALRETPPAFGQGGLQFPARQLIFKLTPTTFMSPFWLPDHPPFGFFFDVRSLNLTEALAVAFFF
jgi:hypothetical protein